MGHYLLGRNYMGGLDLWQAGPFLPGPTHCLGRGLSGLPPAQDPPTRQEGVPHRPSHCSGCIQEGPTPWLTRAGRSNSRPHPVGGQVRPTGQVGCAPDHTQHRSDPYLLQDICARHQKDTCTLTGRGACVQSVAFLLDRVVHSYSCLLNVWND